MKLEVLKDKNLFLFPHNAQISDHQQTAEKVVIFKQFNLYSLQ